MREIIQEDPAKVAQLLETTLGTGEYETVCRLGGLTNHTYHVTLKDGKEFVVRIPGEGTEEMIVRNDEKKSTELACRLGVDAPMLYFGEDGSKVTEYIPNAVTMSADSLKNEEQIHQMAALFRIIHHCGEDTGVPFEVFDMAAGYEAIIEKCKVSMFPDYKEAKQQVMEIKNEIDRAISAPKVPCHNDPLCENWVIGNGRMYLIDWEYAGMNDGMWDVADVSIEAEFGDKEDELLLKAYLEKDPDALDRKHFLASKIYVDYLWTLWAKARVPYDGQPMEDWATQRYARMKENLKKYNTLKEVTK